MKKSLLFVAYGGGHMQVLIPIIKALRHTCNITVLALTASRAQIQRADIDKIRLVGFRDYLFPSDHHALSWGEYFAQEMHHKNSPVSRDETLAYMGLSYQSLIEEEGEADAAKIYASKGRRAFLPVQILRRVFDDVKPDCVITTNSPRAEQAAIAVAKERGVTSISIFDLFGCGDNYDIHANHVFVFCDHAKQTVAEIQKVDPETISVTGNPAFETLQHVTPEDAKIWRKEHMPQWHDHSVLLWCDQPRFVDAFEQTPVMRSEAMVARDLTAIYEACLENDIKLLVRPHPTQDIQFYQDWVKKQEVPAAAMVSIAGNINEAINACDYFGSISSTTLIQAMCMNKPVLKLDYTKEIAAGYMPSVECMWVAERLHDIAPTLQKMLNDYEPRRGLQIPADATQNVCQKILSIIEPIN